MAIQRKQNLGRNLFVSYLFSMAITFLPVIYCVYFVLSPERGTLLKQIQDNFFIYALVCIFFSALSLVFALSKRGLTANIAIRLGLMNGVLTTVMPLAFFFVMIPHYIRMNKSR